MPRFLRNVLLLSSCLALTLPLMGQVYNTPETDVKQGPAVVLEKDAGSSGMLVAIDPVTGELRQPTAAEASVLSAAESQKKAAKGELRMVTLAAGGVMIELDDSFLNYSVLRIGENGHFHASCVGAHEVDTILRLPVRVAQPLEEK